VIRIVAVVFVCIGLYACHKKNIDNVTIIQADVQISDPKLRGIYENYTAKIPPGLNTDWPFQSWSYAKAYTFNFDNNHKYSKYVWSNTGWSQSIKQTIELSEEQAQLALTLIHRTGGGVILTKCPIVPRHAIVFFDKSDQPIGSMNICFSCEDSVIWPPYYEDTQIGYSRYDLRLEKVDEDRDTAVRGDFLIDIAQQESIQNWRSLFNYIGAEQYQNGMNSYK
jgi:hypothetical protein